MPKTKTIQVDEVLPAPSSGKESPRDHSSRKKRPHDHRDDTSPEDATNGPPFPDIASALGWKARVTLQLTQWFLFLRSKRWGNWVIVPVMLFLVLIIIPLTLLGIFTMFILGLISRAIRGPRQR